MCKSKQNLEPDTSLTKHEKEIELTIQISEVIHTDAGIGIDQYQCNETDTSDIYIMGCQ